MKNKASSFLKELISSILTVIKSKSIILKTKTNSLKTRLAIFNLLHNRKLISSAINHKIHAIMGHEKTEEEKNSKALVLYNGDKREYLDMFSSSFNGRDNNENDNDYIYEDEEIANDDEDEEIVNGTDSVIEMVKEKEGAEEFSLEKEINHVADVFIKRFHRQIKMQKLDSFKRYQEMLQRGAE